MAGRRLKEEDFNPRVPLGPCIAPGCNAKSINDRHCAVHWQRELDPAAREYAHANGLRSVQDHIAHTKKLGRGIGKAWTRERMIEHWRKVLSEPPRAYIAHEMATQALANLHAERERVPGEDG